MATYLLFLILGLGSGAAYALLSLGLVQQYRSAGVINFSHGATAMFLGYVYVELRSSGVLTLPWVIAPHSLRLTSGGLSTPVSMLLTLAYAIVLGAAVYWLVVRPLRRASPLAKVGAVVGLTLTFQAIAVLNFGTQTRSTPAFLSQSAIRIAGVAVPENRLELAAIAVLFALALTALMRFTRFGLITRAAADNETAAELLGYSPSLIGAANWIVATILAAAAGVLLAPVSSLDPASYTLFIIPALGAALLARFSSYTIAVCASFVIGMLQSETIKLQAVWSWLPQQGLSDGLPFLVIVIAMLIITRPLSVRGLEARLRAPAIGSPKRPFSTAGGALVLAVSAACVLHGEYRAALITSALTACVCLSQVIITGYLGQISLCQMAFAGVSAFMLSHLTSDWGIGFPWAPLLAAGAAVPLGVLVGLPAVRLRGLNLAVITLSAAAAMDALLFANTWFSGGFAGRHVTPAQLFGLDLGIAGHSAHDYPRLPFAVTAVLVSVLCGLGVALLRRSRLGRAFVAVRSDELAAAAAGINVPAAKLAGFALAAFIAGLGGAFLAYQQTTVSPVSFTVFTSVSVLAITYIGGIGKISGAYVAALLLAPGALAISAVNHVVDLGSYQQLIGGIGLVVMAIRHPSGLVTQRVRPWAGAPKRPWSSRTHALTTGGHASSRAA